MFDINIFITTLISGVFFALGTIIVFLALIGVLHLYLISKLEKDGRYETKKYIWTRTEKNKDV